MKRVVIFGGTAEGRRLTELLAECEFDIDVCVATEYGGSLLPVRTNVNVHVGRMDEEEMVCFLRARTPDYCVDATHPYASEVSGNIVRACMRQEKRLRHLRLLRGEQAVSEGEITYVDTIAAAAEFLRETEGNILITTGSKEIAQYTVIDAYEERCVVRILPTVEAVQKCESLGFQGSRLICMQGPFSEALNYELLKQYDIRWMVTKSTGSCGGFRDKCEAAVRADVHTIIVGRPPEQGGDCYTFQEVVDIVTNGSPNKAFGTDLDGGLDETSAERADKTFDTICTVYIVGMGTGNPEILTGEAVRVLEDSDVLIGSARVLDIWKRYRRGRETRNGSRQKAYFISYKQEEIWSYIEDHAEYTRVALLYSGDIGFYSGAAHIEPPTCAEDAGRGRGRRYRILRIPGVASPIYFLDKLGVSWEDALLVSSHGRQVNLLPMIRDNRKVCTLLGDGSTVSEVCRGLAESGLTHVRVTVGEHLSYDSERITTGLPDAFFDMQFDALAVALFENAVPRIQTVAAGIGDGAFIRGNVPMTKEEIRTLSLSKLGLKKDSVLYDIGAGTGSVSVEAALLMCGGLVYAVEKNAAALKLIAENRNCFAAANIEIVEGKAPEAFEALPAPTHVFIGGSGGRLVEIVRAVREKNVHTRFVVNAVTLETVAKLSALAEEFSEYADMELVQVGVSRSRARGSHHLMMAENPVYIAAFGGV